MSAWQRIIQTLIIIMLGFLIARCLRSYVADGLDVGINREVGRGGFEPPNEGFKGP